MEGILRMVAVEGPAVLLGFISELSDVRAEGILSGGAPALTGARFFVVLPVRLRSKSRRTPAAARRREFVRQQMFQVTRGGGVRASWRNVGPVRPDGALRRRPRWLLSFQKSK
jgi:hypothetical protein